MRNIYDALIDGIEAEKSSSESTDQYLTCLQPKVKSLRLAYRKPPPVYVPYHEEKIQSAYLLTYFPHYYQLIQKIFQERDFDSLTHKESINVIFVGGGPGSEAFGFMKYLNERCDKLERLSITILDINALNWNYSHEIVKHELLADLHLRPGIDLKWQALNYDLTCIDDTNLNRNLFQSANLVVFQNCINEVGNELHGQLFENIDRIFQLLNLNTIFLMIDLTSSVRSILQKLEGHLIEKFKPNYMISTLSNSQHSSMLSLNATPNERVRKFLLDGSNGLIPRKHLNYDYSLFIKGKLIEKKPKKEFGFSGLYSPLSEENLMDFEDVKNKVFIGLDFGTSVTVVSYSYIEDGKILLRTLGINQKDHNNDNSSSPLVPSAMALYIRNEKKQFMFGKHAAEMGANLIYGKDYWDGFKSNLGNLSSLEFPNSLLKDHPKVGISNGKDGLITFLKMLKLGIDQKIDDLFPHFSKNYTWSVPANFGIRQKEELKSCGEEAGFDMDNIPLVEEPISALINYVYESGVYLQNNERILVLDIGAGTVDVSIMEIEKDFDNIVSRLLSVERISEIGGNKINFLMGKKIRNDLPSTIQQKKLELFSERLKLRLCERIITNKNISFKLPPLASSNEIVEIQTDFGRNISISFFEFSILMEEYWEGNDGVNATLASALKKANLQKSDISKIILCGGGSRNPYIRRFTVEMFSGSEVVISDNIQEQVARGNALQSLAQHLFGKNIINSVLHHNVILFDGKTDLDLFKVGTVCPSVEVEKELNTPYFNVKYGLENLLFHVGPVTEPYKVIFYIDSELELKCDILIRNKLMFLKPKVESV